MQSMYEYLNKKGLLKKGKPNIDVIQMASKSEIYNQIDEILDINRDQEISREYSIFAQSASHSLGGGTDVCNRLGCRINNVENLVRYSLLYADRVYIDNFFTRYKHYIAASQTELKKMFYDDLVLLSYLQPSIEKGYVKIFTPKLDVCPHCLSYRDDINYLNDMQKQKIIAIRNNLLSRYLDETTAYLRMDNGKIIVAINGPEELYAHGSLRAHFSKKFFKNIFKDNPSLKNEFDINGNVKLSKKILEQFNIHERETYVLLRDTSFQLLSSNIIGTSFLTDNPINISILNDLTNDYEISKRNLIAEKYLTAIIPFLEEIPINKLIMVREREEEAIASFRAALNQAINDFYKGKEINELQAKQIYSDVIQPSIVGMEKRLKNAKMDLIKNIGSKIIGTGVAIVVGVYSGIIPANLVGIANALGLINIISEIAQQAATVQNIDQVIKNDNYYFLLKLKQQAKY